ncbi:uncharacterized protein MICPUCDRAFT_25109 [Micromonas pusilla CCMP1545]|uniref:tRNA-guanosine(34) queuine transglycosylase n=1 Tax=Micromonas pusilla (strain CCMP1545) TaxID=564608 RepID=C1ML56_MICPC|nr:uncharacterized protein MICPUCDRAFT_25109 [Micromonas pusilla CCMP1545]EEH59874.1 predicted protein [Micromonas pusilla CCMP1545]|eukprot:XP_003056498.1 predicted protein [Micromonas pusilla CCMP1545]
MPVGTQGKFRELYMTFCLRATYFLRNTGTVKVVLGNTYHLENRPGSEILDMFNGLPAFINWKRGTLTDSGGFQMVSLLDLADIEEGVAFQSPVDGRQLFLTPERSMNIQNSIGADILMALDDVVSSASTNDTRFEQATRRTIEWLDRCISAHRRPYQQAMFGIIQGGTDKYLRTTSIEGLLGRNHHLPGYAIGGLAGGEHKKTFCEIVSQCCSRLPRDKPRYVMGVGYPLDIVVCSALGADLYDCVYPSRTARFGTALIPEGVLRLKTTSMATDYRPLDSDCDCLVCKNYCRAHLHAKIKKDPSAASLLTYHNIRFQMRLCTDMHIAIAEQQFTPFVQAFVRRMFPQRPLPQWLREAFELATIEV